MARKKCFCLLDQCSRPHQKTALGVIFIYLFIHLLGRGLRKRAYFYPSFYDLPLGMKPWVPTSKLLSPQITTVLVITLYT